MNNIFTYIRATRTAFRKVIDGLDADTLNRIPQGFNNNIIWNFGHIYVATLGLVYLRTGVEPAKDIPLLTKYTKGSRPEAFVSGEEIAFLKEQAITSIDGLEADYTNRRFQHITAFATDTYGKNMRSIEEVITCTLAHDNFHFGYVKALQKAVLTSPSHLPYNQQQ